VSTIWEGFRLAFKGHVNTHIRFLFRISWVEIPHRTCTSLVEGLVSIPWSPHSTPWSPESTLWSPESTPWSPEVQPFRNIWRGDARVKGSDSGIRAQCTCMRQITGSRPLWRWQGKRS
jgi:hypothetical protein